MDTKTLVDLITIPLFTGVIGYITNWTGVLMLFRPLGFHGVRVPGLRILFPLLPRRVQVLPLIRYDGRLGLAGHRPVARGQDGQHRRRQGPGEARQHLRLLPRARARHASPSTWPASRRARSATSSSRSCGRRTRSCGTTCRR